MPHRRCPWFVPRLTSGPSVIGFADDDEPYSRRIDDLEVVALAPSQLALPDSFGSDNPKYTHFRRRHFKNKRYVASSAWKWSFQNTHMFIIDPRICCRATGYRNPTVSLWWMGIFRRLATMSDAFARDCLQMNPHVWINILTPMRAPNLLLSAFPNFEGFTNSFEGRLDWSKASNRKGRPYKYINARRLALRSQALNRTLMPFNPIEVQPDER